jgi:hypothetical protein
MVQNNILEMKAANPVFPILVYLCIAFCGNANADSIDYLSHKSALLERLDSIDMEKQMRKRNGLPLEELETKSLLIKDSIAALKKSISRTDQKTGLTTARKMPAMSFSKGNHHLPGNAFDWVVFVLAAIALIAGAILCIGLVSMVWKTLAIKKKPRLTTMRENLSLRGERAIRETTALPGGSASEITERALDALKKRMSAAPTDAPAPPGAPFASSTAEAPVQAPAAGKDHEEVIARSGISPSSSAEESRTSGIKTAVIKAASEGADIAEISKRFHVSVDQVSLILRVSHRDNSNQENGKTP